MFRFLLCVVFMVPALAQTPLDPSKDPGLAYVFDMDALPEILIEIDLDQWNTLLTDFDQNPKNEKKVKAHFSFTKNGKTDKLKNIGLRMRGNLSRKRPEGVKGELHNSSDPKWHQGHFKLDFKKYDKPQRFRELRGLNLKFFNNEPAQVREVYCYDLLRRFGVSATPFSSYCRLKIHVAGDPKPAYFGTYEMVENIDKRFLQVRYGKKSAKGNLWKCLHQKSGAADLVDDIEADSKKIGVEDIKMNEKQSFRPSYDLKTNKDNIEPAKKEFLAFMDKLNNLPDDEFQTWIEQHFQVDGFLRFLAVNVLVGMWDDYWVNGNNYYLYFDPTGKVTFIPYDYDNTLGTSLIVYNSGTQSVLHWGPMDYTRPLVYRILSIRKYLDQYRFHLLSLMDPSQDLFDPARSMARIKSWHELIQPHLANDTDGHQKIVDKPAGWARKPFYRLLSGDDRGMPPEANYFKTRVRFAREQLK